MIQGENGNYLESITQSLYLLIKEQLNVYKHLLALVKEKQDVLVKDSVDELQAINQKEEKFVKLIEGLEEKRLKHLELFGKCFSVSASDLTISKLAELVSANWREKFNELHKELAKVLRLIKTVNETNSHLIEHSLAFVNFSLNIYSNMGSNKSGYSMPGRQQSQEQKNKRPIFLDKQV